jgi:hypothetical protein
MKILFGTTFLAGAIALLPLNASAAILTTYTQNTLGSICDSNSAAFGTVNSSCGSFISGDGIDSRASYGNIGIRSLVDGPTSSLSGGVETNDFWRGGAAISDTLSFSVDTGTFRLFTDIAVTLIEDITGSFGGSSFPAGRNVFTISVGSTTIFQRFHEYTNSGGATALTYTDDFGSTGTGFVDLAFSGGSLDLSVSMYSEATCGAQHAGSFANKTGTCRLGVDAFNSIRLIGSTVFDLGGSEIPSGFLSAESGFDYSIGVEPHSPVPVPAPASLPLLIVGLLFLMIGRVRKAGKH